MHPCCCCNLHTVRTELQHRAPAAAQLPSPDTIECAREWQISAKIRTFLGGRARIQKRPTDIDRSIDGWIRPSARHRRREGIRCEDDGRGPVTDGGGPPPKLPPRITRPIRRLSPWLAAHGRPYASRRRGGRHGGPTEIGYVKTWRRSTSPAVTYPVPEPSRNLGPSRTRVACARAPGSARRPAACVPVLRRLALPCPCVCVHHWSTRPGGIQAGRQAGASPYIDRPPENDFTHHNCAITSA